MKYANTPVSDDRSLDPDDCSRHTLVSHVAVLHHNSALLVKYREMPDGQKGWFLPNDDLKHVEHPEEGAKRILRQQVGIEPYDEYRPRYGDVRLSGFLVDALAKALPALSHLERKQVFSSLVKKGIILTSQKQSEMFGEIFAVFSVAEEHPAVKAARETPAVQAASQRLEATLEQGRDLLIRAVNVTKDKNGRVKGAPLGATLRSLNPEFDLKDFHVSKLSDFIGLYPDVLELEGTLTSTDPTYRSKV